MGQRGTTNSRKVALEGNGIGGAEKGRGGQAWTVVKIRARGQAGRRRVNMKDRMPWFPGQGEQPVGVLEPLFILHQQAPQSVSGPAGNESSPFLLA